MLKNQIELLKNDKISIQTTKNTRLNTQFHPMFTLTILILVVYNSN